MARTKKNRSEEVKSVFNNLKYCGFNELEEVIEKANNLLKEKKEEQLATLRKELADLQGKIKKLEE